MNIINKRILISFCIFASALMFFSCGDIENESGDASPRESIEAVSAETSGPLRAYPAGNLDCKIYVYKGSCTNIGSMADTIPMVKTEPTCPSDCNYVPAGGDVTLNEGNYAGVILFSTTEQSPTLPLAAECRNFTIEIGKKTGISFTNYITTGQPAYAQQLIQSLNWLDYDSDGLDNIDDADPWHTDSFKMAEAAFPGTAQAGPVDSANFRMKSITIGQHIQGEVSSTNFKMKAGQAYLAQ